MFFGLGMGEFVIIGVIAVLLFGQRLPEVARSLGKSYNQFRRGLSDIQSELDVSSLEEPRYGNSDIGNSDIGNSDSSNTTEAFSDYDEPTAPKFEPPPREPEESEESEESRS